MVENSQVGWATDGRSRARPKKRRERGCGGAGGSNESEKSKLGDRADRGKLFEHEAGRVVRNGVVETIQIATLALHKKRTPSFLRMQVTQ